MTLSASLKLLETSSSQVVYKTVFNSRYTVFVPDFFIIFTYTSLFLFSAFLDRIFFFFVVFADSNTVLGVLFFIFSLTPVIFTLAIKKFEHECLPDFKVKKWCRYIFKFLLVFFGIDSVILGGTVLKEAFTKEKTSIDRAGFNCHLIFHISNEDLSLIKIYCCINSVVKCIPQLYIVSVFLLKTELNGFIVFVALASIMLNMVIISLTMAITFPIRKTPKIFKSTTCVLLNSFSKFMATLCSCGLNLTIFAMIFTQIGYFSFLVNFLRLLWPVWASWHVLSHAIPLPKCHLAILGIFLTVLFSFIYIHPFEGRGKLLYYYFYLLNFVTEIASIYLLTDADYDFVIIYFSLRVVVIGFVSCFGLFNILHAKEVKTSTGKRFSSEPSTISTSESTSSVHSKYVDKNKNITT